MADNLGEAAITDSAKAIHILFRQGWRGIHSDRGKLGRIADHYQAAVVAGADIFNQILQQVAGAELGSALSLGIVYAYQGDLIDDEELVGKFVRGQGKLAEAVIADGFLAVDAFVDRACRLACVQGEDLRGTACGSEEVAYFLIFIGRFFRIPNRFGRFSSPLVHPFRPQIIKRPDHRRDSRSLSSAGIAVNHQNVSVITSNKIRNLPEQPILILRPIIRKIILETLIEKLPPVHSLYLFLRLKIIITTARIG